MAFVREMLGIERYGYSIDLHPDRTGQIGQLAIWDADYRVADFRFKIEGVPFNPFRYGRDGVVRGDIGIEKRDAIIDLLRNEKPIRLLIWHDGTPDRNIAYIRIGTESCDPEPVGEGELLATSEV